MLITMYLPTLKKVAFLFYKSILIDIIICIENLKYYNIKNKSQGHPTLRIASISSSNKIVFLTILFYIYIKI